jgi:hypothetical protein
MAAFTVIDHTELTGNASSWDVTSIASSYDHLYGIVSCRTDASVYSDQWGLRFNGDASGNYSSTFIYFSSGSAPLSARGSSQNAVQFLYGAAGASAAANVFGQMTFWVPNYSNSANFKSCIARWANPNPSVTDSQYMLGTTAGLWDDTSAIDQITLIDVSGDNFVQYSTFTLYGITGA